MPRVIIDEDEERENEDYWFQIKKFRVNFTK